MARRQREGMEDRLPPGRAAGLGHDRPDDVDQLRDAGGFTRSALLSSVISAPPTSSASSVL
jgi:hypothetical protein